ncbi:MAG: hypothetical protein IJA20_03635 [Methanocorpusculum sp.]|nr:hypothetical protein [Oscillospiraceae bacterium]MBQ3569749.1 hypothetical protein [Methanocorpusculum sp.]
MTKEEFVKQIGITMSNMPEEMAKEVVDVISHVEDFADISKCVHLTGEELEKRARESIAEGYYWRGTVYSMFAVMKGRYVDDTIS